MKERKKLLSIVAVITVLIAIMPMNFLANADDPIEISSYDDLQKIGKDAGFPLDGDYKLANNIANNNDNVTWLPIGTKNAPFTGKFDGNGNTISNLRILYSIPPQGGGIVPTPIEDVGMFGYVGLSGEISNLTIANSAFVEVKAKSPSTVGFIAGNNKGTIKECAVVNSNITTEIVFPSAIGGIAGANGGTIEKCYNASDILVGFQIPPTASVGGIVGRNELVSPATTEPSAPAVLATVKNCFNVGSLSMKTNNQEIEVTRLGGIAGGNYGEIENTYNAGVLSGGSYAGNITGYQDNSNGSDIKTSYYHESIDLGTFDRSASKSTKLTVANMSDLTKFSGFNALDWGIEVGYPYPQLRSVAFTDKASNTTDFSGGNGRVYDPYQINNATHLNNIRKDMSACYKLEKDILFLDWDFQNEQTNTAIAEQKLGSVPSGLDCNGQFYNSGKKWIPLGMVSEEQDGETVVMFESFGGIFDGNGKNIFNLQVSVSESGDALAGFFAINEGIIKNFNIADKPTATQADGLIEDADLKSIFIDGSNLTGVSGSKVSATSAGASSVSGSVVSTNEIQGIITGVKNSATVEAIANKKSEPTSAYTACAGGIAGINNSTILNVENKDLVVAKSNSFNSISGGIAGANNAKTGVINKASNAGTVYAGYDLYTPDELLNIGLEKILKNGAFAAGGIVGKTSRILASDAETKIVTDAKNKGGVMTQFISGSETDKFCAGGIIGYVDGKSTGIMASDSTYWSETAKSAIGNKAGEYSSSAKSYSSFSSISGYDENSFLTFSIPNKPTGDEGYTTDNYQSHLDEKIASSPPKLYKNTSSSTVAVDVANSYEQSLNQVLVSVTATEKNPAVGQDPIVLDVNFIITFSVPGKITSDNYTVVDSVNVIAGVSTNTTLAQFKSQIDQSQNIQVYRQSVKQTRDDTIIGTGFVVKIMDGNTVINEYTVSVKGDLTRSGVTPGDGKINITDFIAIKAKILDVPSNFTGKSAYEIAADYNDDGKINITDMIQILAIVRQGGG
ncbi:MAG: dockerin type I repeat-containing protein [Acutalibacteraceae bacterium]